MDPFGTQDFVTMLHAMSSNNVKINDTFRTFIQDLKSLLNELQDHHSLSDFRKSVSELLSGLEVLHQRYKDLVRDSRRVAGDVQSRLEDFVNVLLPALHEPSTQWAGMKAELESCLQDMWQKQAETRHIVDNFSTLSKYVQDASSQCGNLHKFLTKDLKRKHRQILKEFTDKLKDCAMKLVKWLLDGVQGATSEIDIIMNIAPTLVEACALAGRYVYGCWCITQSASQFRRVRESEWQKNSLQFSETAVTTRNAWRGIISEMECLQAYIAEKADQDDAAPLCHIDTQWQAKAPMYADMTFSLRRYQIAVV